MDSQHLKDLLTCISLAIGICGTAWTLVMRARQSLVAAWIGPKRPRRRSNRTIDDEIVDLVTFLTSVVSRIEEDRSTEFSRTVAQELWRFVCNLEIQAKVASRNTSGDVAEQCAALRVLSQVQTPEARSRARAHAVATAMDEHAPDEVRRVAQWVVDYLDGAPRCSRLDGCSAGEGTDAHWAERPEPGERADSVQRGSAT